MTQPVTNKLPKLFGDSALSGAAQNLNVDVTVLLALACMLVMWFILYKTKWGLRVRAVGEHPAAADTLGIHVSATRYVCVILSGVLAGFGGASMTLAVIPQFTPVAISGQGFIALAAVIFGNGRHMARMGHVCCSALHKRLLYSWVGVKHRSHRKFWQCCPIF